MSTLPQSKFRVGQRVQIRDEFQEKETGVVVAILYAEEASGEHWTRPGCTYFVRFDSPRSFEDTAHESELLEVGDEL